MKCALLSALLPLLCFAAVPAGYCAPLQARTAVYKEGELIVRFKNPLKAAKSVSARNSSIIRKFQRFPLHQIRLPAGVPVREAAAEYRNDPNVLYAEPNYLVRKSVTPNDPSYGAQWNMPQISAPSAWDLFAGSRGADAVIVAVLDTGVAYYHADLVPNIWKNSGEICGDGLDNDNNGIIDDCYGANFGGITPGDPWDDDTADSHGTHVAGIIGASGNNGEGISGINWATRLMSVKFLHGPEGLGELADALRGVEYALAKGARIINMSFEVDEDSVSLRDAVAAAEHAGALVVSAAGNTGKDLDQAGVFPASIRSPGNIAVAASTSGDVLPAYSDFGRHTVELAAPGGVTTGSADAVLSTVWLNGGSRLYRTTAGTSMAVPHVAGAAALIWNLNPALTAAQVKARILNGVDKIPSFSECVITGGRLNLEKTLRMPDLPTVFDVSPYRLSWDGGAVSVSGVNFGAAPGSITLGGITLSVTSWSDTAISAVIPKGAAGGDIQVNAAGNSFPVTVLPAITVTASIDSGIVPLTVELHAQIQSGPEITRYEWDFGDGIFREVSGAATHVTHTFDTVGTHQVRIRITDSNGAMWFGTLPIQVTADDIAVFEENSGCFIATATYGSYLHPKVQLLRNFRDRTLLCLPGGRMFVSVYYRLSPPLAHFIARHEVARYFSRWAIITPLLLVIQYPVYTFAAVMLVCPVAVVLVLRRKRNRF